jgi:hypothetical protein
MTYLKRCVWAVAIGTLAASGAFAQTTGGTGGGGLGGGGGGLGGGATNNIAAQAAATAQAPTIGSTAAGFSNPVTQPSNILTPFYANPTYAGAQRASGTTVIGPGGFGQQTVAGGGTTAAGTGGRATAAGRTGGTTTGGIGGVGGGLGGTTTGARTTGTLGGATTGLGGTAGGTRAAGGLGTAGGLGGTAGGLGGTTRGGGFGGTAGGLGGANNTNQQLSTGRQIAYTQSLKFGVAPLSAPQLQTDVSTLISTSSTLSGVAGLQAVVGDGGVVLLRGKVADEDEAKLVEGMIRLTPGVKDVKNELEFPKP